MPNTARSAMPNITRGDARLINLAFLSRTNIDRPVAERSRSPKCV